MAEQITLWLHGKNHSATLSVDDGSHPLQVHVSVQGQEAHVHFASEQAHTRQWLGSASEQLRQLLHNHGLHLADVSVDAGGAGHAGGSGSGQHPPGVAQRLAARQELARPAAASALVAHTGVDCFV